jgi:hypothetical protein
MSLIYYVCFYEFQWGLCPHEIASINLCISYENLLWVSVPFDLSKGFANMTTAQLASPMRCNLLSIQLHIKCEHNFNMG